MYEENARKTIREHVLSLVGKTGSQNFGIIRNRIRNRSRSEIIEEIEKMRAEGILHAEVVINKTGRKVTVVSLIKS